jgi:hypothetical protein
MVRVFSGKQILLACVPQKLRLRWRLWNKCFIKEEFQEKGREAGHIMGSSQ